MQVERKHGEKNKTIYCNVPPMLPGKTLDHAADMQKSTGITPRFGDFTVAAFMARYLAGNRSLREARQVSRKRLALVASAVGYLDPEAYELNQQIQRYIKAKKKFVATPHHTINSILALNAVIAPENTITGTIRTVQNWVGGKTVFTARYVSPPPEMVPELFENWLDFINNETPSGEIKAIIGHCRLLSIHPFAEGNGRTARLIMDGLLEKNYDDSVPLLTYRLSPSCPPEGYIEALKLLDVGDPQGLSHPFWHQAIAWSDKLQVAIVDILTASKKQINHIIGLKMLSSASLKLLNHIWSQPIVCQSGLLTLFDGDIAQVNVAINDLVNVGILQTRKLRAPENAVIYDCPIIFAAYKAIDDALFNV